MNLSLYYKPEDRSKPSLKYYKQWTIRRCRVFLFSFWKKEKNFHSLNLEKILKPEIEIALHYPRPNMFRNLFDVEYDRCSITRRNFIWYIFTGNNIHWFDLFLLVTKKRALISTFQAWFKIAKQNMAYSWR